ncbi:MAG: hypothetical protein ACTSWA_10480 [Candidatus Thorarchaeota archaeon]
MKNYETGVSSKVYASVLVAIIVTAGVFIAATNLPGGGITPTTTAPTTTPTNPTHSLGARAALYLNSMRDNVVYYWMCNSTFVNNNLTEYYDSVHPGAFVDGLYMTENEIGGEINILFAPYHLDIVGTGNLSENEWNGMSGSLIDDGLGMMEEATNPPTGDWPHTWPVDFYMFACFNDSTFFYFGYTSGDGLAFIQNGTWAGSAYDQGGPYPVTWDSGYWLEAGDHLTIPLQNLYTTITNAVSYPE